MSNQPGPTWTIIVAAGFGSRFGDPTPKQFVAIGDRRVIDWTTQAAAAVSDGVVIVLPASGEYACAVLPADLSCEVRSVAGGATRSESVRNGLAAVPEAAQVVLVHDAARPVASPALFARVVDAVGAGAEAVVPVVGVVDTMRHVDGEAVDRANLQAVQTPQGFRADVLRRGHAQGGDATDDATLVAMAGAQIVTVPGERWNIKLTEPLDVVVVSALLSQAHR